MSIWESQVRGLGDTSDGEASAKQKSEEGAGTQNNVEDQDYTKAAAVQQKYCRTHERQAKRLEGGGGGWGGEEASGKASLCSG